MATTLSREMTKKFAIAHLRLNFDVTPADLMYVLSELDRRWDELIARFGDYFNPKEFVEYELENAPDYKLR